MAEKTTITVHKAIICSQCHELYHVCLEPVYDKNGFLSYVRDNFENHVCPNCGNTDKGERLTKDGKILIGK